MSFFQTPFHFKKERLGTFITKPMLVSCSSKLSLQTVDMNVYIEIVEQEGNSSKEAVELESEEDGIC